MLPTPNLDHITSNDYENVYEPAEDTFLFLDALENDIEFLKNDVNPCICLEIGSGTGCVSTFLGQLLGDGSTLLLCTDINPFATAITVKTAIRNSIHLDAITTNLTSGLLPRLYHKVDILCFNPPYVVTSSEDVNSKNFIERAWAGGIYGREVIDRMLPLANDLLSSNGVFYLLVISDNKPDEICERMWRDYKFQFKISASRLAGREKQFILKFWRNQT
ncbi:S-adenosyl-L-methionine-dependent methyltransferase [Gigaspora rosea]|uniref:S-adenosyl-L-methionine-dependent methyltransferase n=1 Tax=Gigaspora rosea TaxID=44941 RepID=A0A397UUJ0_9GLOM|nr:S-adenosyl-L-methionine-dependent methyltransferase [Gigaspora rosea]